MNNNNQNIAHLNESNDDDQKLLQLNGLDDSDQILQIDKLLLNDSMCKFITLNARGTKIQIPISIAKKSQLIKAWLDTDREENEEFYINFNPQKVHDMIDKLAGYSDINIEDYLMIDTNVCVLSWKRLTKNYTHWHSLYMYFSFTRIEMCLDCKYWNDIKHTLDINDISTFYGCDTNISNMSKYCKIDDSDEFYIINHCFSFEAIINCKRMNIPISNEVFCNVIQKMAKEKNITINTYIRVNNLFHFSEHLKKTVLVLGCFNSTIQGELVKNLMIAHEEEIKEKFNVSDNIFKRMLISLKDIVHVNTQIMTQYYGIFNLCS